jgi:hypothetical protein
MRNIVEQEPGQRRQSPCPLSVYLKYAHAGEETQQTVQSLLIGVQQSGQLRTALLAASKLVGNGQFGRHRN